MYSLLILVLAAANAWLFLEVLRQWRATREPLLVLLLPVVAALPYDAALLGAGRWLSGGDALPVLSALKVLLSNLSLPLLFVALALLLRAAGLRVAQGQGFAVAAVVLALGAAVVDGRALLVPPPLHPACWEDTLRYVASVPDGQACFARQGGVEVGTPLPVAALLALPALVMSGILVWRRRDYPWLFLGGVAGFLLLGLPVSSYGPIPGVIGQTIYVGSVALTALHFLRHPPPQRVPRYGWLPADSARNMR